MAFQSVPDTIGVVVRITCNNQPITNTYYVEKPGGYTSTDVLTAAVTAYEWWELQMAPLMPVAAFMTGVEARGLALENDTVVEYAPANVFGTVASNPLPSNVAFCVKRTSAFSGRSARGRVYIAPLHAA